ncbi:MAG: hypothetical protein IJO33_01010 [Bacilli bacterium]|nr:hypothetical protein [Bacilli bacterium]
MNMDNIAIVRATNVVPFNGVVRPLSNVPYLCKNIGLPFSTRLSDLLHELQVIPPIDYSRVFEDGYYDEMVALSSKILKEYLPYVSDYNSMVLFSLNGICPDDNENGFGNNVFSTKKVAVIDSLSNHIEQVVSLDPTDTALKGDVLLSADAVVLIEEEYYAQLTEDQRKTLHNNCFEVKTFRGPIKDAIYDELKNSGRFIPENLSLTSGKGGFDNSETSEMQKECIKNIAASYGIPQMKFFNLITSRDSSMPNYDKACDDYSNAYLVQENYIVNFLNELLIFFETSLNVSLENASSESLKTALYVSLQKAKEARDRINMDSKIVTYKPFLTSIIELIKKVGINNYKNFVDNYNKKLELQQANMTLVTPEEIVNSNKKKSQGI